MLRFELTAELATYCIFVGSLIGQIKTRPSGRWFLHHSYSTPLLMPSR